MFIDKMVMQQQFLSWHDITSTLGPLLESVASISNVCFLAFLFAFCPCGAPQTQRGFNFLHSQFFLSVQGDG